MASLKLIFNRKNKLNSEGKAPVEIRIIAERVTKYVTTGILIKPEQWDVQQQKINKKHPLQTKLNLFLLQKLADLEDAESKSILKGRRPDAQEIKDIATGRDKGSDLFFADWCFKILEQNKSIAEATIKHRKTFIERLKRFNPRLRFDDINYKFMREFEQFLYADINPRTGSKLQQVSIHGQIKILKHFLYEAHREELIVSVPNYRVEKGENEKEALTEEELKRIEDLKIPDSLLKKVRDMFLFSSYTALRFGDMESLTKNNIRTVAEGIELHVKMHKVKKPVNLPLWKLFDGKPEIILKDYLNKNTETIFDSPPNQTVNKNLKLIRIMAQIEKPLTFHISRHTCLTIIGKLSGSPYLVMEIAGHSDIRTSMVYTKGVVNKELYNLLD